MHNLQTLEGWTARSKNATRGREGTASSRAVKLLLLTKRHGRRPYPPGACHMSKPPRDYTSFGSNTYFVAAGLWGKRSLFQTERMAKLLVDTLFHYLWKANTCSTSLLSCRIISICCSLHQKTLPVPCSSSRADSRFEPRRNLDSAWKSGNGGTWNIGFGMRAITNITSDIFGIIPLEPGW